MTALPWAQHVCLVALLVGADAALALSYDSLAAWVLMVLPLASLVARLPFVRLPSTPPRVAAGLVWTSRAAIGALAAIGVTAAPGLGLVLAALAGIFLIDARAYPVGAALLPAALGVLLAAGFAVSPGHYEAVAWACAAALALWLTLRPASGLSLRRLALLLLFAACSAAIGAAIIRFLPWAQPHVETALYRVVQPNAGDVGFGAGGRLGELESLAMSRKTVLRLWSDSPRALRLGVYTRFDGKAWRGSAVAPSPHMLRRTTAPLAVPAGWDAEVPGDWFVDEQADGPAVLARIVLASAPIGALPAPAGVQAVRVNSSAVLLSSFGVVMAPPSLPDSYGIRRVSGPGPASDPPAVISECLEPPVQVDPRIRALAEHLARGAAGPKEKIVRTVAYLRSACRYSLEVGRWRTKDPIAEFLFDKKKGYCEYFASAAVILLRLQGVPARYVNGLSVREDNWRDGYYLVRTSDGHAWAEALVPEEGWVEVDATPPGDYALAQSHFAESRLERWLEVLKAAWAERMARHRGLGGVLMALVRQLLWPIGFLTGLLVLIAAGVLVRRFWRRRRRAPAAARPTDAVDPRLAACFARLERLWVEAGCPRPPHHGPLEHLGQLPSDDATASLRAASEQVVDGLYRSAYGGQRLGDAEIAALAELLDRVPPIRGDSSRSTRPSREVLARARD